MDEFFKSPIKKLNKFFKTLSIDPPTTSPQKTFPRKLNFLGNKLLKLSLTTYYQLQQIRPFPSCLPFLLQTLLSLALVSQVTKEFTPTLLTARKFRQEEEPVEKILSYTPFRTKSLQETFSMEKIVLYIIILTFGLCFQE